MSEAGRGNHTAHDNGANGDGSRTISRTEAVAMGTVVMIGAGIFSLTGQIAESAGPPFPLSFVVGGWVTSLAAYSRLVVRHRRYRQRLSDQSNIATIMA